MGEFEDADLIDEFFTETSIEDDPFLRLSYLHGENKRLQEHVAGYRAGLFALLGFVVIWGVVLTVNRTAPLRLNGCEALVYYLDAADQSSSDLPVETRQLLNAKAATCKNETDDNDRDGG